MNGVYINDRHSLRDFGVYLQPKSIPVPNPKISTVKIDGADGQIDLTTALTDGNTLYENREIELKFAVIGTDRDLSDRIDAFTLEVHGKIVKLIFDDDTEHYYKGRMSIDKREYKNGYVILTCKVSAEPYRYAIDTTLVRRTIGKSRTNPSSQYTFTNSRMWVSPTITVSHDTQLMYQGKYYDIPAGTHQYRDIILRDGDNVMAFMVDPDVAGIATVTLEYQQGVL